MVAQPFDLLLCSRADRAVRQLRKAQVNDAPTTSLVLGQISGRLRTSLEAHVHRVLQLSLKQDITRLALQRFHPIIIRIILFLLPLNGRIAMSHTCHAIRAVALSTPGLWYSVSIGPKDTFLTPAQAEDPPIWVKEPARTWSGVLTVLERCRGLAPRVLPRVSCTINVDVTEQDEAMERLLEGVAMHASMLRLTPYSWTNVTLGMTDELGRERGTMMRAMDVPLSTGWTVFCHALRCPAPNLQTLYLTIQESFARTSSVERVLHPGLFSADAPQLRRLYLTGITLPSEGCPALSGLTLFDYRPAPGRLSDTDLHRILSLMPSLKVFGLVIDSFSRSIPSPIFQKHPCLTQVAIGCLYESAPMACDIVDFLGELDVEETLLDFSGPLSGFSETIRPANFRNDLFPCPEKVMIDDERVLMVNGKQHIIFSSWRWTDVISDSKIETFANMTSFTITTSLWGDEELPDAPRVEELCLLLPSCAAFPRDMRDIPGALLLPCKQPWSCPSLKSLHIAAYAPNPLGKCPRSSPELPVECCCSNGCTISLQDVAEFITKGLEFKSSRLSALHLSGIQAIAESDPTQTYLALYTLAETVEITSEVDQVILSTSRKRFGMMKNSMHLVVVLLIGDRSFGLQEGHLAVILKAQYDLFVAHCNMSKFFVCLYTLYITSNIISS